MLRSRDQTCQETIVWCCCRRLKALSHRQHSSSTSALRNSIGWTQLQRTLVTSTSMDLSRSLRLFHSWVVCRRWPFTGWRLILFTTLLFLIRPISAKWTEWNWRIYTVFTFVCLCSRTADAGRDRRLAQRDRRLPAHYLADIGLCTLWAPYHSSVICISFVLNCKNGLGDM